MRPTPSFTDSRPSAPRYSKGTRHRKLTYNAINKERVFAAMSSRYPASTLEPFLGTYRIVWDSESNYDPRDVLFDDARPDRDPEHGLLTLSRPQRAQAWPKEPGPCSSVVLRFCDSFLGTDRTASVLKLSPRPTPASSSALSPLATSNSSSSSLLSPPPSPYTTPSPSSTSTSSSSASRAPSSSSTSSARVDGDSPGPRRFWRFDWDPSFPRLGFRFEGMDLTGARGHTLSFSRIRDDRGCPFAVVELRPTAWDKSDAREGGGATRRTYITVVAKRVPDRYAREGLSDAERVRLGMIALDELDAGGLPFD